MNSYVQPERPLTQEEKLLAAVVEVNERIPVGFQIGMRLHLDAAVAKVETLFNEHDLPLREEILAELTLWRNHAEDGLKFSQECDRLMTLVIRGLEPKKTASRE